MLLRLRLKALQSLRMSADTTHQEVLEKIDTVEPESDLSAIAATSEVAYESEDQLAPLLAGIVQADEQALANLYDATVARVYNLILRILRQPSLAEEVVTDTYFQVWRQAVRFDPKRGKAIAWLLAMARSRAIDALRHEARFTHEPLGADDLMLLTIPELYASEALNAEHYLDARKTNAHLHQALCDLGAQPRQLIALAFFKGLSHEEIADHTAIPLGTVKSQIRRALISLKTSLNGDNNKSVMQ
jgi:RNA polymerase sigma factor (sigma-70 family)